MLSSSKRLYVSPTQSFSPRRRYHLAFYLKCALCILIIYYLNLLFGFKYYIWSEKSFEDEYSAQMLHIDGIEIEKHPENTLGQPKNILPNRFLIENEYLCGRSLDPETLLHPHTLILVKSPAENIQERQAIRLTWAERNRMTKRDCRLAFVLGMDTHNTSIKNEAKKYGDIIQIDKMDYYYYSSYKMIMMLRWITDHCTAKSQRLQHTDLRQYVLFVGDDYFIDIDSLSLYMRNIDNDPDMTTYERRTFITGELVEGSRPRRFLSNRYYVSINDYPYDRYPPYISTGCFLMTRYNARLFYLASKYIRLFHFDHVYMGLIAYSMSINLIRNNELFPTGLSTVVHLNNRTELFSRWKEIFLGNSDLHAERKPICIRGYRAQKLIDLWNEIYQTNLTFSAH